MFLPVSDDDFNAAVSSVVKVEPVMEFRREDDAKPAVQQVHKQSGSALWELTCTYEHEMDFEPEFFKVKVGCVGEPSLTVPGPIRFGGLAFRTWNMNSKKGLAISADTWTQDPKPSTKRASKADAPPSTSDSGKAA